LKARDPERRLNLSVDVPVSQLALVFSVLTEVLVATEKQQYISSYREKFENVTQMNLEDFRIRRQ